ncbi:MAG: ribonuclease HII [Cyanobacteria bacterium REEB65]|nr:ribonuclease HII [Cyanobacteria bacterium REEB65]
MEQAFQASGCRYVAGVDEAGRGPLAGPVVAAAVVLPARGNSGYRSARRALCKLDDSKKVPPRQRTLLAERIFQHAIAWGIGLADRQTIDRINILQATFAAMRDALADLQRRFPEVAYDVVLVDGRLAIPGLAVRQEAIVAGDGRCAAIAAASILAKVHRDELMLGCHERFPDYGFDRHKGYPTPEHLAALARLGPCEIHRQSFRPVQEEAARKHPPPTRTC